MEIVLRSPESFKNSLIAGSVIEQLLNYSGTFMNENNINVIFDNVSHADKRTVKDCLRVVYDRMNDNVSAVASIIQFMRNNKSCTLASTGN